jgi:hypothetical protein
VPTYLSPGVYFEGVASFVDGPRVRPRPPVDATTALALLEAWESPPPPPVFVGFTTRGPVGEPVFVNAQSFERSFGESPAGSPFSSCVKSYFASGAEWCWVVRAPLDSALPNEFAGSARSRAAIAKLLSDNLLESVGPFSAVAVPDAMDVAGDSAVAMPDYEAAANLHLSMINVCDRVRSGVPILDAPMLPTVTDVIAWRATTSGFDWSDAIVVYPWCRSRASERTISRGVFPSSCAVAALLSGPGGHFGELGGVEPAVVLDHNDARRLQESGVTPILATIRGGGRIDHWPSVGQFSRRSAGRQFEFSIYDAIKRGTSWAIFRVGEPSLWARLETEIASFLDVLWRRGHLDGESAEVAYDVRCDDTTNHSDASQVITSVTFQVAPGKRHQLRVVHFLG